MPSINEIKYPTPSQPRQIRFDSTTRCNAHCLSCHRFLSERKGEMPTSLIEQILLDAASFPQPLDEIVPVNYGEFFLRQDWFEILVKIAQILPYTKITLATNGALVNEGVVQKLCKIPNFSVINFSVNAYYDETYENFMGLKPDTIIKIRKAIALFRILRPDIRLKVSMVFDPVYQTDLERDYFEWYWKGWAETWVIAAASANRPDKKPIKPVLLPCRSIFSDFVVGYDGKLSTCCFDPNMNLDLGFYSGKLLSDWHNDKITELRKLHNEHRRTEVELCRGCTFA